MQHLDTTNKSPAPDCTREMRGGGTVSVRKVCQVRTRVYVRSSSLVEHPPPKEKSSRRSGRSVSVVPCMFLEHLKCEGKKGEGQIHRQGGKG